MFVWKTEARTMATSSTRNVPLNIYIASVVAGGIVVLGGAVRHAADSHPLGSRPAVAILFGVLLALGEARPLRWFTGRDGLEITASWTFSLGLVAIAPVGTALIVVALGSGLVEIGKGKPLHRTAFNVGQLTLSLGAAGAVLAASGTKTDLWSLHGPNVGWLVATTCAGLTAVLVNGVLTALVLAFSEKVGAGVVLARTLRADLVMDGLLVGLAPVLTGVAIRSFVLLPLLLAVVLGVYHSARIGLAHRHEATHDILTGLPNRRLFYEQAALTLDLARTRSRTPAVLLIDLDGFKEINDRLGHAVGDLTLREVAARLLKHRRSTDVVARLGGDEFAILFGSDLDVESAERLSRALLHSLREPLDVDGIPVAVSGSVGVALFPFHGEDIETLLAHADAAMYRAKSGKIGVQIYDDSRDRNGPTRLGLLGELRQAIVDDQLIVVYQPEIDLATGLVCGSEALVRWQHPVRGLLMPDHFVPAAEQTELVDELTERVLRLAVAQAAAWRTAGYDLRVAINTSARNLQQMQFPDLVSSVLAEHSLPANLLELEITENTVTDDPIRTETVLGKLKHLGVSLAVDDFGTGYSSLAHLRNLPIDRIKIDRSFVRGVLTNRGDLVIVRCIIDLANNLGLESVAEGIEDEATLQLLQSLGCRIGQGYHVARPGDAAAVERLTRRRAALAAGAGLLEVPK